MTKFFNLMKKDIVLLRNIKNNHVFIKLLIVQLYTFSQHSHKSQ